MTCVIGIDIGTTSTIGILLDTKKNLIIKKKSIDVDLFSIKEGWAEEDPNQWWQNTKEIIKDLSKFAKSKNKKIISIGTTGMLPALVILNNKGRVIRTAVKEIRSAGRNTQGVRIFKLSGEEKVVTAIKIDDNFI